MDHLGLKRASIGGHSIGGRLAWTFASLHPELVQRLVLRTRISRPAMRSTPRVRIRAQTRRAEVESHRVGELSVDRWKSNSRCQSHARRREAGIGKHDIASIYQ